MYWCIFNNHIKIGEQGGGIEGKRGGLATVAALIPLLLKSFVSVESAVLRALVSEFKLLLKVESAVDRAEIIYIYI